MPTTHSTNWRHQLAQIAVTEHRIANGGVNILIGLIKDQLAHIKAHPDASYQGDTAANMLVKNIQTLLKDWNIAIQPTKTTDWQQSIHQTSIKLNTMSDAIVLQCLQFPNEVNYLKHLNWDDLIARARPNVGPVVDFVLTMYEIEHCFSNLAL